MPGPAITLVALATAAVFGAVAAKGSIAESPPPSPPAKSCSRPLGTHQIGGQLTVVPRGLPASPPLMLAFHSLGGDARYLAEDESDLAEVAAREHFAVVFPTSTAASKGGHGWQLTPAQGDSDITMTRQVIDTLVSRLCLDPHRVYATGLSNGAGFTARVGCELADKVAAIAPVAGDYGAAGSCPADAPPMPTLEIHGRDPWLKTVPNLMQATAARNRCTKPEVVRMLRAGGIRISWPGCGLARVQLSRIGHAWPRGPDVDWSGYNASAELWSFVSRFRR
jgi:polyhydroxybutyrate depolymerase